MKISKYTDGLSLIVLYPEDNAFLKIINPSNSEISNAEIISHDEIDELYSLLIVKGVVEF